MTDPQAPQSRRENRAAAPKGRTKPSSDGAAAGATGIGAIFTKHPVAWLAGGLSLAFVLLATGALFAGAATANRADDETTTADTSIESGRAQPTEIAAASRLRTCSVSAIANDPKLATLSGAVTNAVSGEVLFDRAATTGVAQAGLSKVLTASAAINLLGPDATLSTKVYQGSTPTTIVLVGGGDPTITALDGGESVYSGAPKLQTLADNTKKAYEGTGGDIEDVTAIVLDASMWSQADKWDATWPRSAQTGGSQSEVTALQVDGDRADPTQQISPRSADPVTNAGVKFAEALGLDPADVTFSLGNAVTTKPLLGEVKSQPISVLINQMLMQNDGTLAESLARVVSKAAGYGGSAASIQQAITSGLAVFGVPTAGILIQDGSGLSPATNIPPKFMSDFMAKVLAGENNLNVVYNSLPIAGKSGGLAQRFAGASAAAKNQVIAMPGSASGEYSLSGVINAADGAQLAFAFYAIGGGVRDSARASLDALATAIFACGDNLSNN